MSRKNLILLGLLAIVVLIGIGVIFYFQSFKTITFDVKKEGLTVNIRSASGTTDYGTFTANTELRLQAGKYIAALKSEKYDNSDIAFEVKDEGLTVTIDPSLSESYLSQLLTPELSTINKVITDAYPQQMKNFTIKTGRLYKEGEWYGTVLVQKTQSRADDPDIYRIVLRKENGKWSIKAKPALVLSAKTYPEIPFEILSAVNQKT